MRLALISPPGNGQIASIVSRLALVVALAVATILPLGYFILTYQGLVYHLETKAKVMAGTIATLAGDNPESWVHQSQRMAELLARYPVSLEHEETTVRDATGRILVRAGEPPRPPALRRSHAVQESGRVVGRVEIAHSLLESIYGAALAALLGLLLGGAVYATLRILPLRALRRITAAWLGEKERYATAVESGIDGYAVVDTQGRFLEVNAALCALTGYSRRELLRLGIPDVEAVETGSQTAAHIASIIASGRDRFETRWKRRDGVVIDVEMAATHRAQNGGELFFFIHDITGRKQGVAALRASKEHAEQLLEENQKVLREFQASEARYGALVKTMAEGVVIRDASGTIIDCNPSVGRILGVDPSRLIGRASIVLEGRAVHEDGSPYSEADRPSNVALRTGEPTTVATRGIRKPDGALVWVSGNSQPLFKPGATVPYAVVTTFRDVTDRKQAEDALRASEERFRGLIEQSVTGIFVMRGPILLYANPRFAELLGCRLDEILGTDISGFAHPEDLPMVQEYRLRTEQGEHTAFNLRVRRKDGVEVVLGVNSLRTLFDGTSAVIGMAQDITERKRAQNQIAAHVKQLESAMLGTVRAVSTMVELRDPYTAGHERRVGALAKALGVELGLAEERCKGLEMTGLVHDIGKIVVPAEILSKPGRLTPAEFDLIKAHPQAGYDILKDVEFPWPLAATILQHHERLDGSGYPRGLKGDAILLEARIIAVADVVEAMASHRPYRPGLGIEKALEEITLNRGKFYAPEVADACIRLFRERGYTLPA